MRLERLMNNGYPMLFLPQFLVLGWIHLRTTRLGQQHLLSVAIIGSRKRAIKKQLVLAYKSPAHLKLTRFQTLLSWMIHWEWA